MRATCVLLALLLVALSSPASAIPLPPLGPPPLSADNPFGATETLFVTVTDEGPWMRVTMHYVYAQSDVNGDLKVLAGDFDHYEAHLHLGGVGGLIGASNHLVIQGSQFKAYSHIWQTDGFIHTPGDLILAFPKPGGSGGPLAPSTPWVQVEVQLHRTGGSVETIAQGMNPGTGLGSFL